MKLLICFISIFILSFSKQDNGEIIFTKKKVKNMKSIYFIKGVDTIKYDVNKKINDYTFKVGFAPETVILNFQKKCICFNISYDHGDTAIKSIIVEPSLQAKYFFIKYNYLRDYTTRQTAFSDKPEQNCECK